jgi:hypothetical protein
MTTLKKVDSIKNIRKTEQLLSELFFNDRQVCKDHINQLKYVFELLSTKDASEMKQQLYALFEYDDDLENFKIANMN